MAEDMKVNIKMIRNMVTVSTLGLMEGNTKVGGAEASSMDSESTLYQTRK